MKKVFKSLVVLFLSLGIIGCNSKPSGMGDAIYDTGCKILETVDEYLDGDLTKDEAYEKVHDLQKEFADSDAEDKGVKLATMKIDLELVRYDFDANSLQEARDELADCLGK